MLSFKSLLFFLTLLTEYQIGYNMLAQHFLPITNGILKFKATESVFLICQTNCAGISLQKE